MNPAKVKLAVSPLMSRIFCFLLGTVVAHDEQHGIIVARFTRSDICVPLRRIVLYLHGLLESTLHIVKRILGSLKDEKYKKAMRISGVAMTAMAILL